MDTSSNSYDPHPFGSSCLPETSTSSDVITYRSSLSDEEVILASSRPKKCAGRKKFKETRHPIYRGIKRRNSNKWVCELREPNKKSRIWLGTYPTAEMAARAHDVAALALRGQLACLNFADSVWRLPVPATKDAKDIRKAAVAAAELFRPEEGWEVISQDSEKACDGVTCSEERTEDVDNVFMDDDAMFDTYGLIASMAEGLLLSPPPYFEGSFTWNNVESDAEILTDAALLKRQKKEIEELRAKLQGSHSEHFEEEILNLRDTLLQTELERERIALELEEEKKAQAEREKRLQEQARKIENLSSMVLCSNRDENRDPYKKVCTVINIHLITFLLLFIDVGSVWFAVKYFLLW